jgi:putative DNA primase/helicase
VSEDAQAGSEQAEEKPKGAPRRTKLGLASELTRHYELRLTAQRRPYALRGRVRYFLDRKGQGREDLRADLRDAWVSEGYDADPPADGILNAVIADMRRDAAKREPDPETPAEVASRLIGSGESDDAWPSPHDPMAVARRYMQGYTLDGMPLLRRWRGTWMRWETTRWAEADDASVRSELYTALEHAIWVGEGKDGEPVESSWRPNKNKIANVLDALGAITHLPDTVNPPAWLARGGTRSAYCRTNPIVACANGLLDVGTRQLQDHDPAFFNVVSVPFPYEAGAVAPAWTEFLGQLWPDDQDAVDALQEWIGYLLSGRTDMHKILLVIGPTRAGKGTIGRITKMLLGEDNVAGPTLSSLSTNFGLAPLIGKPLATIADARLPGASHVVVERLLSISGEDTLTIDRKFREPWTGQLPTRLMIMSNELPGFGDASGAIARRFIVLVLSNSWLGRENTKLTDQLAGELPGIFNWALDGLARLAENGRFTEPKSSADAIVSLLDQASPISAFVRDCCDRDPAHEVPVDGIYAAWKTWCADNGRDKPGTKQAFGKHLNAAAPGIRTVQPREDGSRRYRAYQGIRLKESWERRMRDSWDHNGPDRVPPRASRTEPVAEASPLERDGTRENPLRDQLGKNAHAEGSGRPGDVATDAAGTCTGCGLPLDPVLAGAGDTTHPTCAEDPAA